MSVTRHDQTAILSQAVVHGETVYLAGIVAKELAKDIKGQTKEIVDDIEDEAIQDDNQAEFERLVPRSLHQVGFCRLLVESSVP